MDNKIYCGDNLEIMRTFPNEFVDLIYLDPPFFSGRNYEVIWGDNNEIRSFKDRWEGGMSLDLPELDIRKDVFFEFNNPHNLIITVYYTSSKGTSEYKDFNDVTKAFRFWLNKPMRRNSQSFISMRPQHGDSFPFNFHESGYSCQIALKETGVKG